MYYINYFIRISILLKKYIRKIQKGTLISQKISTSGDSALWRKVPLLNLRKFKSDFKATLRENVLEYSSMFCLKIAYSPMPCIQMQRKIEVQLKALVSCCSGAHVSLCRVLLGFGLVCGGGQQWQHVCITRREAFSSDVSVLPQQTVQTNRIHLQTFENIWHILTHSECRK